MTILFNTLQRPYVSDFAYAAQSRMDSSNWAALWSVGRVSSGNLGLTPDLFTIYHLIALSTMGCFASKINFAKQTVLLGVYTASFNHEL